MYASRDSAPRLAIGNRHVSHTGEKRKWSWPISGILSWTAIHLGPESPQGSSHLPAGSAGRLIACLLGVAPGGGCRVSPFPDCVGKAAAQARRPPSHLPSGAGAEPLPCSGRLCLRAWARRQAGKDSSLWPYSSPHGVWALPSTLPYGVPTFLCGVEPRSGRLASFAYMIPRRRAKVPAPWFPRHRRL